WATWLPVIISTLSRLVLLVVLVATTAAGRTLLQITMLSGTLPCSVQDDRVSDTVAVNGVPTAPRISYDVSFGPLGVLPTLPENPVWLLQAATENAIAAPSALIDKVRTRYRMATLAIAITASVSATASAGGGAAAGLGGGRCGGMGRRISRGGSKI